MNFVHFALWESAGLRGFHEVSGGFQDFFVRRNKKLDAGCEILIFIKYIAVQ